MKSIETVGKKFNMLTIISISKYGRRVYATCKCECGNIKQINLSNIISGKQKSCGCLRKEMVSKGLLHLQHGMSNHPLHNIWDKIKARCYNSKDCAYKNYGGRGIKMCEEWKNDFVNFYEWAIKNGYKKGLSIDRIDNNNNYCPENCRWATAKQQANNRRNNRLITYNGKTKNMLAWSEEKRIPYQTLFARIYVYKWEINKALETPVKK